MKIVIIGAGASGLMAARELAKAGKEVVILEARDRIGGRIWPLAKNDFGYDAQGGAEFVHGPAPVTKALLKDAGLTYIAMPEDGEMWTIRNGKLEKNSGDPMENKEFEAHQSELKQKLKELKTDIPVSVFLSQNFAEEKYLGLRAWITRMVEGFDAADVDQISTYSIRDEWLGEDEWEQGRVKEGYKAMLDFLESECRKYHVEILFNQKVNSVEMNESGVEIKTFEGKSFQGEMIIVTVSLPLIKQIEFIPALPDKFNAASEIGFGQVIKMLLRFKKSFWASKMSFLFSAETVGTWWTQYPEVHPVLTGWVAGPKAIKLKDKTNDELLDLALISLGNIYKIDPKDLRKELVASKIINWPVDPLALGAYSYSKVESEKAYEELRKPVDNKIFFAGEALYLEKETATVEGALASGNAVAKKIL